MFKLADVGVTILELEEDMDFTGGETETQEQLRSPKREKTVSIARLCSDALCCLYHNCTQSVSIRKQRAQPSEIRAMVT